MKRLQITFLAVSILAIFLPSCKKYEEGPVLSFSSKEQRLLGVWQPEYVLIDEKDKTRFYEDYRFDFQEEGVFTFQDTAIVDSQVVTRTQKGFWEFRNDKEEVLIRYTTPPIYPDNVTYTILMLKRKELWLQEEKEGKTWVYRLVPEGSLSE